MDQFTLDTCNKRADGYGGSIENRSRFGLEVAKAVVDAVGADRTGIRLSPFSSFQGMKVKDPVSQFSHLLKGLKQHNLAYVHVVESRISGNAEIDSKEKIDFVLDIWGKMSPLLVAGGFKPDSAKRAAKEEYQEQRCCHRIRALLHLEPRFAIQAQTRVGVGEIQSGYILQGQINGGLYGLSV